MKSIHEMTSVEIHANKLAGVPVYGTVMYRPSLTEGVSGSVYSDLENFCPETLMGTILAMRGQGWRQVLPNRYTDAGMHPQLAAEPAEERELRSHQNRGNVRCGRVSA